MGAYIVATAIIAGNEKRYVSVEARVLGSIYEGEKE